MQEKRICRLCQSETTEFYRDRRICKACRLAQIQERAQRQLALIRDLKTKPCADCGIQYPHYVMDFDHIEDNKSFGLNKGHHMSMKRLLEEIQKCDIVCSNCHRERTYRRLQRVESSISQAAST